MKKSVSCMLIIVSMLFVVYVVYTHYSNENYAYNPWVNGGFCKGSESSPCYYWPNDATDRQPPYLGTESNSSARSGNPISNCNGMLACSWNNGYMKWLADKQISARPAHYTDNEYDQLSKQLAKYSALDPNGVTPFEWITPKPVEVVSKKGPPQSNPRASPVRQV